MGDVSVSTEIDAPAEAIYDLVADLPRMGEWSPECDRVSWSSAAKPSEVGAEFIGHNRIGWRRWSTHGTVTVLDRPREFAFEVRSVLDLPVARWSYRFIPKAGGGCRVIESVEDRRGRLIRLIGTLATGVRDRDARNRQTMTETLDRLRAAMETRAKGGC